PSDRVSVWGAVSHAVRTPSRSEDDIITPIPAINPFLLLPGNRAVESEEVIAYEFGARGQPAEEFYWDVALFYNDYTSLVTSFPVFPPPIFQLVIGNQVTHEQTWGYELAANYDVTEHWRTRLSYSFLRGVGALGRNIADSPRNQVYFQSSWDLNYGLSFDWIGRYVDHIGGIPGPLPAGPFAVPSYFEMDSRLAWQATDSIELFVVGRNLLDKHHLEFVSDQNGLIGTEVPREIYAGVAIRH
ncbi:MAG: TonB-dependent receptor, partial [Planctomycetales bacterium]